MLLSFHEDSTSPKFLLLHNLELGCARTIILILRVEGSRINAVCIARLLHLSYTFSMITFTVRLPERLSAEIAAEAHTRNISKSDIVRERLEHSTSAKNDAPGASTLDLIALI